MASTLVIDGSTFAFITLKGEPEPLSMVLEDITRPGEAGHAYWEVGNRGKPFWMVGTADYTNKTSALNSYTSMAGKVGKSGTITDDHGLISINLTLLETERRRLLPILNPVGGLLGASATCLLVVGLLLQKTR